MVKKNFTIIVLFLCFIADVQSQDFQVSTHSAVEFSPHIAADSSGNFVIVWDDCRNVKIPYGGKGSNSDIYGQRYNNKGYPIGSNFRITDDSTSTDISFAGQILPRVSMNKRGEFVVTWIDGRPKGDPSDPSIAIEFNIYAQRFDMNGNFVGSNFLVNDTATSGQLDPDVVVCDDGSFAIVWENTLEDKSTYLQMYDSNGNKIQSNQKLDISGAGPKIELLKNENFLIVARGAAQIYSPSSGEKGQPFGISMGFTTEIGISKDDKIFIIYARNIFLSGKYIDKDVFINVYDTLGNSLDNEIRVNDDLTDYWQKSPTLSVDNEHVFVAWQDYRNGYQRGDGVCVDIYGQRFDLNLTRIGGNFKVSHEEDEAGQSSPTTVLWNDTIYVAWFDHRNMEYYGTIYPPIPKLDVWGTIQDFNNPVEGTVIYCQPPSTESPASFNLYQCFPNPTQSASTFTYDLPEDANVKLTLYSILGKEVKKLIDEFQEAGQYSKSFTIDDLSSGIYYARLTAKYSAGNSASSVIKVVLIK